jgi:3-carboxy-cis,cis-muconate cycloisomerase
MLARGGVPAAVSDDAWLAAMLSVEAALAGASADAGLVPATAAAAIAEACARPTFDPAAVGREAAVHGTPVVPLVAALRAAVAPDVASFVHRGATSQDVVDTAAMLIARDAVAVIVSDVDGAADAAARLAQAHRDTVMIGRTLLQHAVPVTFGLTAAGWLSGLDAAAGELRRFRPAVQLGGAAGTLDGLDPAVVTGMGARLGLDAPDLPWHTERSRITTLAAALGVAAGALAKPARDVTLLAQNEIGEVSEGSPGGSSAMAHKRNPVAAVSTLAAALQAPGLVATLLAAAAQEHQRAAGAWQAEWQPLRALLVSVGSAAAWLRVCLTELVVHPDAMRARVSGSTGHAGALVDAALAAHRRTRA